MNTSTVKEALILDVKDSFQRRLLTRYGVNPQEVKRHVAQLLNANREDAAYVEVVGKCYVREFHTLKV